MDVLRGFRGIKANLVINRDDSEQEDGEVSDESNVEYEGGDNAMQAINPGYRRKRSSATKINHSESTSRKGALERLKYLKYETKSKNHFERSSSGAGIHMFSPRHHDIESDFGIDDSTSGNTMDEERRSKKRRTDDTVDDEKYGSKSVERRYPQLSFSPSLLARHVEFSKGVDQPTTLRQRVERLILTPSAEMLNLGYPELRSHLVRMIHLDREQDRLLAGRKSQIDELRGMLKSIRKDVDRFMHQLPMHLRGDIHLPVSSATEIGVKPRNAEAFNISASEPQQTAVLNQQNSLPNRMNEQRFKFHMPPPNIGGTPVFSHSLAPQRLPPLPISLSNQLPSFGVPNVRPSASQPSYQHGLTGHPLPFQMGAKTNFNHPQTVMHGGGSALSSSMSSLGADNLPAARDSCIKLSASTSAAISHNVLESNSVKPGEAKSHAEVLDTTMGTQPRSNESYGAVVSLPVGISFPPPPQLYGRSTRNEQAPTLDSISVNPFMNASHPDAFPSSPVGSNIPPVIPASNSNNSGPSHVRCSDRTMPLVGNESHNFNANMPGTPYFKPPSDNQSIRAGSYSVSSMSRNSPQLAFSTASLDSSLAASNNEISKNNNSQMKTSVGSNISTIVDLPSEKLAGNLPILPMMNPSVPPPSFTMPPPRLGQVSSSFPMAPASTGHVTRVPASMNSSPSFPPNQMSSNLYSFPGPAPPIPMNLNCPPPNLSCPPVMPRYMHQGNPVNTPHNISGGPVPEAAVERNANTFRASSGEQRSNTAFYQPQVVVPMQFVPSPMYIPYGNTNFFPTFTCVQNYQQMVQEAGAIHMRKLFIGGISHETTDDDLRNYYGQWGDVVDCIVIRDPNTKCSRGFGFVTFATFLMAEAALASKPHFINGKLVDSKPAIPREQMTANFYNNRLPILGVTESEPGCKIFLSGLDFASLGYSVDPLRQHFGVYGTVEQVEVLNIKGTGFIIYEQKSQADECLAAGRIHQINGHEFGVTRDLTFVDKEYSKTNENQLSPGNSVSETDFNGGGCVTIETTAKSSSVSTEYELDSPQQISNSKPKLGGEYSPKVRNVNGVEYHRHNCRMNSESKTILNGFKTNKAMKKRKQEKN